ncbi:hypothetical protein IG631_23636 [Alternaria alternata]|nr:hypothetical protein IG631_23636 [Alternaria alternata]
MVKQHLLTKKKKEKRNPTIKQPTHSVSTSGAQVHRFPHDTFRLSIRHKIRLDIHRVDSDEHEEANDRGSGGFGATSQFLVCRNLSEKLTAMKWMGRRCQVARRAMQKTLTRVVEVMRRLCNYALLESICNSLLARAQ